MAPPFPGTPQHEVADLRFRSLDGLTIGAWVTRPRDGADQVMIVGHGYMGRSEPVLDDVPDGTLAVFPVARGLPVVSLVRGVGGDAGVAHVLWGIDEPRTYSHVGSAADMWLATTVARELLPNARRTVYMGGSFGGGIGALALAFDPRVDAAVLEAPSFGNHAWRATVRCTGSGELVRNYLREHPDVLRTLQYTDAASAALRIRSPALVLPALADPAVPPPGQFAVAMSMAGPTWVHVLPWAHCDWIGHEIQLLDRRESISTFLADPIGSTASPD